MTRFLVLPTLVSELSLLKHGYLYLAVCFFEGEVYTKKNPPYCAVLVLIITYCENDCTFTATQLHLYVQNELGQAKSCSLA